MNGEINMHLNNKDQRVVSFNNDAAPRLVAGRRTCLYAFNLGSVRTRQKRREAMREMLYIIFMYLHIRRQKACLLTCESSFFGTELAACMRLNACPRIIITTTQTNSSRGNDGKSRTKVMINDDRSEKKKGSEAVLSSF